MAKEKKIVARIESMASHFGGDKISSDTLAQRLGLQPGWIEERTGIKNRYFLREDQQNSDLSVEVVNQLLKKSGKKISDIDLIIGCTNSPDKWMPGLAHAVHRKVEAPHTVGAYDVVSACAGWLSGLQIAKGLVESGINRNVIVIGSEAMSRFLNWEDHSTAVLFGDGAAGALVSQGSPGCEGEILDVILRSQGKEGEILEFPGTGSQLPASHEVVDKKLHLIKMDGERVFSHAVRKMSAIGNEILKKNNLSLDSIDWLVPHQANLWILKFVIEKMSIPESKVAMNIVDHGNTTAATIPSCFDQFIEAGKIKHGELVLMVAFGAGLSWAGALVKW